MSGYQQYEYDQTEYGGDGAAYGPETGQFSPHHADPSYDYYGQGTPTSLWNAGFASPFPNDDSGMNMYYAQQQQAEPARSPPKKTKSKTMDFATWQRVHGREDHMTRKVKKMVSRKTALLLEGESQASSPSLYTDGVSLAPGGGEGSPGSLVRVLCQAVYI